MSTTSSSSQLGRVAGDRKVPASATKVTLGSVTKIKKDKKRGKLVKDHYKPPDDVLKKNVRAVELLNKLVKDGFPPR